MSKRVNPSDQNDVAGDEDKPFQAKSGGSSQYRGSSSSSSLKLLQCAVLLLAIVLIIIIIVFAVLISRRPPRDELERIDYNQKTLQVEEGGRFGSLYSTKGGAIGVGIDNPSTQFDVLGDIHAYGNILGDNIHTMGSLGALSGLHVGVKKNLYVDSQGKLALQHYNTSIPLSNELSVNGTASILGELNVGGSDGVKVSSGGLSNIASLDMKAGAKVLKQGDACSIRGFQVDSAGDVFFCKGKSLYKVCCSNPV